jgi:hypothetical protein
MVAGGVEPDAIVFNSFIASNATRGDLAGAEAWFNRLELAGLQANDRTYVQKTTPTSLYYIF